MKYRYVHILVLFLICALVFGYKAGDRDFWGRHGEARRAEVSREMVASGDWVVPHLNGDPFVTKPPLYYWAAAWMFTVTGHVDELSARIPSIIAGTLGVFVTYLWASTLFTARIGFLAGIILATNFLYGGMARTAGIDMMLTFFTTASLYCFTLGYTWRKPTDIPGKWTRSTVMYMLSAACIGFGTLTKNPIGFVAPILAIGVFILVTRDFSLFLETKPWWLLIIFLVIVLPWFVMVYQRVPNFFEILNQETLGRYIDPEGAPHYEPFYYYLPSLSAFAPWVIFLPGVILSLITRKTSQISRSHLFVLIAFVTTFLLFSSVGSKREYYLLPLYPFLAILVAKYWYEYLQVRKTSAKRWLWKLIDIPVVIFAGILCVLGVGLPIAAQIFLPQYTLLSVLFGFLFLTSGVLMLLALSRGQLLLTFGALSTTTILIYLFTLMTIVPEMDAYRSRKEFFHNVSSLVGEQDLINYKYWEYASQFYLQRLIPELYSPTELDMKFQENNLTFVLTPYEYYEELQNEHPHLAGKLKVILDQTWTSAIDPKRKRRLVLLRT